MSSKRLILRISIFVMFGVFLWTEEILHANVCDVVSSSRNAIVRPPTMFRGGNKGSGSTKQAAPLLIIHAGPGKTATTTVQWVATQNGAMLQEDNIYYLGHEDKSKTGRDMHEFNRICQEIDINPECATKWAWLQEQLDYHYSQNHTVFLSEEMLSQFPSAEIEDENLWKYLDPVFAKWNVRIIFTYRRYTEWIPSKYHQGFNPNGPLRTNAIRTNWPSPDGKVIQNSNTTGGRIIQPFPLYFDSKFKKDRFEYPHIVRQRWSQRFVDHGLKNVDFEVFNMHQDGEFLHNFYCQVIPEAKSICGYLGSDAARDAVAVQNPSEKKTLHFDMLGVAAYRKGWVDKNLFRPDVTDAVEAHAQTLGYQKLTDFPHLHCLSKEQVDKMLSLAIRYEYDMLGSAADEATLRSKFESDMTKGKYCSVHVQETIQETQWKNFFLNLDQEQVEAVQEELKRKKRLQRRASNQTLAHENVK